MKAPTTRYHRVLFDQEKPFRSQRVESKKQYKRKAKYRQDYEIEDRF